MIKSCIISIGKNENHYIREWVEHHKELGFNKIFLGDNNDIDGENFNEVINDYIQSGFVEVINLRGKKQYQILFYKEQLLKIYTDYNYCAIIDIDEYIELNKMFKTIDIFLSQEIFNDAHQIRLCWKIYDDNDLIDVENNNYSIKRFNRFLTTNETNTEVKSIINLNNFNEDYINFINCHGYGGRNIKLISVDCDGELCGGRNQLFEKLPKYTNAWINHYMTKTCGEFIKQKYLRGNAVSKTKFRSSPEFFFIINKKTEEKEIYINKLIKYMKIKHYILIRFFCLDNTHNPHWLNKEQLFNQKFLDENIKIFEKYLLKSLENQTNNNFEIIIMIHNEIDENHPSILKLKQIKSTIKINIIRFNEINDFLQNHLDDNYDYMITSKIDHDDLIYNEAVEEIQNKCNKNVPFYWMGYDKLITMINDNYLDTYKFYPDYKGVGAMSTFQSIILNTKIIKNIKYYHAFGLGHVNNKQSFINWFINNNLEFKEDYYNINHLEDSAIYIKHNFNMSSYEHNILNTKWHRTNIKVDKPKEWFIERFGNFIDE